MIFFIFNERIYIYWSYFCKLGYKLVVFGKFPGIKNSTFRKCRKHCWFQIVTKVMGISSTIGEARLFYIFVGRWIFFYWCSKKGSKLRSMFFRCFKFDFKRVSQYCFKGIFLIISHFLTNLFEYAYVFLLIDSLL